MDVGLPMIKVKLRLLLVIPKEVFSFLCGGTLIKQKSYFVTGGLLGMEGDIVDMGLEFWGVMLGLGLICFVIWFISASYIKAPPDKAYIISGLRKDRKGGLPYKVVIGRAAIRIPFFERIDRLNLNLMQVDIKTQSPVPTAEYINIFIDGVANIKIGADMDSIAKAAENFLGRDPAHIAMVAQQVLEGNMREIVGQMQLSDLVQNRDKFAVMVQENALSDMKKLWNSPSRMLTTTDCL